MKSLRGWHKRKYKRKTRLPALEKNPKTNRKKTTNNWIESMNAKKINIKLYYNTICLYENKNPRNRHCDLRQSRRYLRILAYIILYILFPKREKATRTRTVNARLTCVGCSGVRCWRNPRSLGGGPLLYYRTHTDTCLVLYYNYQESPSKKKKRKISTINEFIIS